ncbi:SGNH/GDSL hydrolase family protein [Schleiferilactobacillus shenzhenensis]|uniref:SGNH hydrolase-type esterase domain-containing protein n=1 Tax=Schleiferilactobacillus shenzhenensis LY-73 TaxID=1231336 RepID=U4TKH2_9LACO|nr:SGNH/GDSL hydrolase family protein [Schleiferilactobacillus shenzhenensis]ERL65326.1 hypothetical protein L248_2725 [Schleiferilactobacillus shenzhenensis LY-73]
MTWTAGNANGLFSGLHFSGRWIPRRVADQDAMYTTNLGAAIHFQIDGASSTILHFVETPRPVPSQIAIRIDNGRYVHFDLAHTPVMLATTPTVHQISVVMSGNTDDDPVWAADQDAGFAFTGVTLPNGGQLAPIVPAGPRLTFIGDSITAGCWVAGKTPAKDYRGEASYAAITATKMNAEETRIAYSAAGILQPGRGGVPAAKDFFGHLDNRTPWAVDTEQDAVIINLGTNDQDYPVEEFVTAYIRFAAQLRGVYDDRPIFLMIPFNQTFAEPIRHVARRGDRLQIIETKDWTIETTDGTHPNLVGHKNAARHLVGVLQKALAQNQE